MISRRFPSPAGSAPVESASVSAGGDIAEFVPEFPGCRPIRITREAIADHESRIEYWDVGDRDGLGGVRVERSTTRIRARFSAGC